MELCDCGSLWDAVVGGKFHDPPPRPRGSSNGGATVRVDVQSSIEVSDLQ